MKTIARSAFTLCLGLAVPAASPAADALPTARLQLATLPGKPVWNGAATVTPLALNAQQKPSIVVLRVPAGTQAQAAHATRDGRIRFAIVLSGVMYYADGEQVDRSREKAYPAGSVLLISSGTKHWVSSRESDVTLLLTATDPAGLTPPVKQQIGLKE